MQVWLDYHLQKRRFSFQTNVWHTSCLAKPPLPSPMEYGWRTVKDFLLPVYFDGNMSAEFLRDLVGVHARGNRNVKCPVFVQSRTLHVLTYVLAKDQNHVKTSIHISLQKTFNVLTA
jgi:hypothetical protein